MYVEDIPLYRQDIQLQYIKAFQSGDYTTCLSLLEEYGSIDGADEVFNYALVAGVINGISTILTEQQNYTAYQSIQNLSSDTISAYNILISQLKNMSAYSSTETYSLYNFVAYNDLIYMYISETPSSGNVPTDTTYWLQIGLKGEDGARGTNLSLKYEWNSLVSYSAYDLVWHNDVGWVALSANTNQEPNANSTYWQQFISSTSASIEIYNSELTTGYNGQIYVLIV